MPVWQRNFDELSFRLVLMMLSTALVTALYWGLSQAESRAIHASWDKLLHASVFFIIWWLGRWSLRLSWVWLSVLVVLGGGAEEIHQIFLDGHMPSLDDWYADIVGVLGAVTIYLFGKGLAALRASVAERDEIVALERRDVAAWGRHALDCRWTFKIWRWNFYIVLLGGKERRALSSQEQALARLSVWVLISGFVMASTAVVVCVLLLVQAALGWHSSKVLMGVLRDLLQ